MDCPLVAFKMAMEPSEPPAAILLPSGDHATAKTKRAIDACQSCCRVWAFQTCTVPSFPQEARFFPSGDQATSMTGPACPQYASSRAEGVGVPVDGQVGVVGVGIR